ncbi:uncharacterized protein LOC109598357 [Aethina tumida]|uniref:uncharacterized protein LOC109598357 n=1 Tax=Aethina tumida TaxID=116153 RepID=UPI00096B36D4|nr:uncharacterized protein LOC109598357 [Aethina tumida]
MRPLLVIVLSFLVFGNINAVSTSRKVDPQLRFGEDIVNNTIIQIVSAIPEPLQINNLNFNLPSPIEGSIAVDSIAISGIKDLVATYIKVGLLTVSVDMTLEVPDVKVTISNYKADINLMGLLDLPSSGDINVELSGLQVGVYSSVNLSPISLKNTQFSINLEDSKFDIKGILNNKDISQFISSILSSTIAPYLNDYTALLSDVLSPIIEGVINSFLNQDSNEAKQIVKAIELINEQAKNL